MHIPLEIWFEIIAEVGVSGTNDNDVDSKSLSCCAQVCSLWRDRSQSLLFGSIDLMSNAVGTFHCLMDCIGSRSERSRILKSYIRVLKVHIGSTTSPQIGAECRLEFYPQVADCYQDFDKKSLHDYCHIVLPWNH